MNQVFRVSRVLKTAVCAGVLGFIVSGAQASVITLDAKAVSGSNGAVVSPDGKTVTIAPAGATTVNLNLFAVLHSADGTQTNDGLASSAFSLLGGSGNVGTFTGTNVAPFNDLSATPGTPSANALGPDQPGVANGSVQQSFQPIANGSSTVFGTSATSGDLSFLVGTATVTYNGNGGTTISVVPHIDSNGFGPGRHIQFVLDGNTYALNGNGAGLESLAAGGTNSFAAGSGQVDTGAPITVVGAPEPGSLALVALGGMGLLLRRRK